MKIDHFLNCFKILKKCAVEQSLVNIQLAPSYLQLSPKDKQVIDAIFVTMQEQNLPYNRGLL